MANEATYTNLLGPATPLTAEAIEKATREIEPIAAEIRRLDAEIAHHLGIHADHVKYLTGNWAVSPPPMLSGGFPLTSLTIDEVDRYPHTCHRRFNPPPLTFRPARDILSLCCGELPRCCSWAPARP